MANVLAEVMRNGEQSIEEVSLLSAAERSEILEERTNRSRAAGKQPRKS